MCSIIGWAGQLPKGAITGLLRAGQSRGKDSTGLAFRTSRGSLVYKKAQKADQFIRINQRSLAEARESTIGIAHTRRASPGLPINDASAHPFIWRKTIFAHNGRVENWKDLKITLGLAYKDDLDARGRIAEFINDTQAFGPFIDNLDTWDCGFSQIEGCMGLVWFNKEGNLYAFHHKKELSGAIITYDAGAMDGKSEIVTLALIASTEKMIMNGLSTDSVSKNAMNIQIDWVPLDEGILYQACPPTTTEKAKIVAVRPIPVYKEAKEDIFSSEEME